MAKRWKYDLETEKLTACAAVISDGSENVSALQKKIKDKHKRQRQDPSYISKKLKQLEADYRTQLTEIETKWQDMDTLLQNVPWLNHSWRTSLCGELQRKTDRLTEENTELKIKLKSLQEYQRQENTRFTQEINKLSEDNNRLKKMLQELEISTENLQKEKQEIEDKLNDRLWEAERKILRLKYEVLANAEEANTKLRRFEKNQRTKNARLKTQIDELSETNDSLKKSLIDLQEEREKTEANLKHELKKANTKFQKETDTTKQLKMRLEEFDQFWRSQELTYCITPADIAQKMRSLYENEWTDAKNSLNSTKPEAFAEEELLRILKTVYEHSRGIYWKINFENVQKAMPEIPAETLQGYSTYGSDYGACLSTGIKQQITIIRKHIAQFALKIMRSNLTAQVTLPNVSDDLTAYYNKCVEVCWLVAVQDPPLFINFNPREEGDAFFEVIKTDGIYAGCLVWPALLEREHGAVLVKGKVVDTRSRSYMRDIKPTGRSRSRSSSRSVWD